MTAGSSTLSLTGGCGCESTVRIQGNKVIGHGCFASELITTFRQLSSHVKSHQVKIKCDICISAPSNCQWLGNRAWVTDFSKHVVMTRYVSLALRLRPAFFAAIAKNHTVGISTKVVLYFCAVQYHTILYRCFSMGPGIFKATILAVELQCPLIALTQNFWQSLSSIVINMQKKKTKKKQQTNKD